MTRLSLDRSGGGRRCPLSRGQGGRWERETGGEALFSPLPFGGWEGRHGRGAAGEGAREARFGAVAGETP
jgi:hypothetical protein